MISVAVLVLGKPILNKKSAEAPAFNAIQDETLDMNGINFYGSDNDYDNSSLFNIDNSVLEDKCQFPPQRGSRFRSSCSIKVSVTVNMQYYCMSSDPTNSTVYCTKGEERVTCTCLLKDGIPKFPTKLCHLYSRQDI